MAAFDARRIANTESISWPPAAARIRSFREALGLQSATVAEQLEITIDSYEDIETYDDEVFTTLSLKALTALSVLLSVSTETILLGDSGHCDEAVTFDQLAARLHGKVQASSMGVSGIEQEAGWDIAEILRNSDALWEFNVEGLYGLCRVVDIDWVCALPRATSPRSLNKEGSLRSPLS